MRSHAIKAILTGRIAEFLLGNYNRNRGFSVREICAYLREVKFEPRVVDYIRRADGIDERQIAWLLNVLKNPTNRLFGFIPKNRAIVREVCERKQHIAGERRWAIAPTAKLMENGKWKR